MLKYTTRPISDRTWLRPEDQRRGSQFTVKWAQALDLLEREVEFLGGRDVVIECDVREQDLRLDGRIRASARPETPAIVVAFESKHGPLLYRCDQFQAVYADQMADWQHNVYAVAKTLEALRAVDRYGAAQRGEQYRGYRQIEAPPAPTGKRAARAYLRQVTGIVDANVKDADLIRAAKRMSHPDVGGDRSVWDKVMDAERLLEQP